MATDLSSFIIAASSNHGLDPNWVGSVAQVESGQQANGPDSSTGAMGPMQLEPGTAAQMGATNPRDPEQNIWAGTKYLGQMLDRYQSPELALAAYNAGPGRVDDYLNQGRPLPAETLAYVPKVLAAYQQRTAANSPAGSASAAGTPAPYQVASADTGAASDADPNPNAPPSAAAVPTSPTPAGGDPFSAMMQAATAATGGASGQAGAAAPTAPTAAPAGQDQASAGTTAPAAGSDPFSDLMTAASKASPAPAVSPSPAAGVPPSAAGGSASAATGTPSTAPAPTAPASPGFVQGAAITADRVLHDVTDRPAELLASGANALGITGALNSGIGYVNNLLGTNISAAPTGNQLATSNQQGLAGYKAAYGSNPVMEAGRVVGDVAASVPMLASAGGIARAGADLAAAGVGALSPAAGTAIAAGTDYAAGAGGAGNLLARSGSLAGNGALQGTGAAAITSGSSDAPIGNQLATGAVTGGLLGAAAPAVAKVIGGAGSALLGGTISPETAALAQTARDTYGIPLQAGQISSSPFVRFMSDQLGKLPFSGASSAAANQTTAVNQAIASTFGSTADQITPEVMAAARDRLGNTFDNLSNQITVQADTPMLDALGTIESRAQSALTADRAQVVSNQVSNVLDKASQGNGTIDGAAYQALVSKGGALDDAMNSGDPGVRNFSGQIRDAIEDAMQRQAPPDLSQQLAEARLQYKNLMTVAPLVKSAQDGNLSPLKLLGAVKSNFDDMAFSGAGPLGELATIGQRFLRPPPDSGTATRNMILGGLGAVSPSGIAAFSQAPIGATGAALGTLGTVVGGRAISAYMRSPYAANRLISNGLAGNPGNALVNALAGNAGAAGAIGLRPADQAQVNLLAPGQ